MIICHHIAVPTFDRTCAHRICWRLESKQIRRCAKLKVTPSVLNFLRPLHSKEMNETVV